MMDPNAVLAELRRLLDIGDPGDYLSICTLVEGLDNWLCKGGFLPDAWREAKSIPTHEEERS